MLDQDGHHLNLTMVLGPAAAASGNLLERQMIGLAPDLPSQEVLGVRPSKLCFDTFYFFPADTDGVFSVTAADLGCHLHLKMRQGRPREGTFAKSI